MARRAQRSQASKRYINPVGSVRQPLSQTAQRGANQFANKNDSHYNKFIRLIFACSNHAGNKFAPQTMSFPESSADKPGAHDATVAQSAAHPGAVKSVASEELLGIRGELKIQHNGELYSLRRTRQGKLILTK